MKRTVITLCGSTKFKSEFIDINKWLTLTGNIVITVGVFAHDGEPITLEEKLNLDDIHKQKIEMADEIFVIDVNGYIGKSTSSEIKYALELRKPIRYLSEELNVFEDWLRRYYLRTLNKNWNNV